MAGGHVTGSTLRFVRVGALVMLGVAGGWSTTAQAQSRVVDAVRAGDTAAARRLLVRKVDVNVAEADGTTALHWAVRAGDADLVAALLKAGAKASTANRYGVTPLALAATNGDARTIELLLGAGANVNDAGAEGQTPMLLAARSGNAAAIRALAARGADVNAGEKWMGETPLMWASAENHAAAVRTLVELGAKVDARSGTVKYPAQKPADPSNYVTSSVPAGQWTALMYAARQGATDVARTLLELGANVNVQDPEGYTPLLEAIVNGHFDLAAELVNRGANPNLADKSGMAALYATIEMRTPPWERSRPDIKENDVLDCVDLMKVLIAHGANVNQPLTARTLQRYHANGPAFFGPGTTPLMRAAKYDNRDMVELLVQNGADVRAVQPDGTNALMLAAGIKYAITQEGDPEKSGTADDAYEIARLLLDRGVDVNAANAKGETALYGAAFTGRNRMLSYLVERGARLDAKTKQDLTILDAALNIGVSDDGTGSRVGGKPGESTVTLVKSLMAKAGLSATSAASKDNVEVLGTRPERQQNPAAPANGSGR